ncbi:isoprenylcysteine carboxylmethyltransferase family protein [uncultured Desulfobacter sp.]|uniref:methyltransferase family protein n=1 Tax=uncultured Desulfobacter sp. TaxID=240139 RepID=UPI002AABAEE3|nr:isoprenylcysteine carboxylmethyltransferase family protein [uncultured Desulfobacter sp.]
MILFFAIMVYSVFVQIRFTGVLFVFGVLLFGLSAIGTIAAYTAYFKAPLNQLVREGVYRISRNPIYVCVAGMMLGIALMCHSVIIAGITVLQFILQHGIILEEETYCRTIHGKDYLEYFENVPRYLLFF